MMMGWFGNGLFAELCWGKRRLRRLTAIRTVGAPNTEQNRVVAG